MESKFQYRFSHKANADLEDIVSYIAVELSNPQAASDFVKELEKVIDGTRSFPESGALVCNEFLSNTGVRKKLINNYIMYYCICCIIIVNYTNIMICIFRNNYIKYIFIFL